MIEQLRQLDETKAQFISLVSHDLRGPLGAIIAYAEHLMSNEIGPLNEQQMKGLDVINRQCRFLTSMVNNILDMAKLQSGKMEFLKEPFDLAAVLESVRALYEMVAKGKGYAFVVKAPAEGVWALGDAEKVQQVVNNLLSNAMKFTPAGGTVELGLREAKGGLIETWVRDTGCGIPPDELPRMFERFHQINQQAQRSAKIRGTGLGLSISKAVVDALGGSIWVESRLGEGSVFRFTLPKAARPAPAARAASAGGTHGG